MQSIFAHSSHLQTAARGCLAVGLCAFSLSCGSQMAQPGDSPGVSADLATHRQQAWVAPAYTSKQVLADLQALLISRPGPLSGRHLGNPANLALWTPYKVQQLTIGLRVAQATFYPEIPLRDFARLILAEAAQESTGDFNLGVRPVDLQDHASQGLLQVTPASVLLDYKNYGLPIKDATGKVLLDPAKAERLSLANVCTNVLLWAWYTRNSVAFGVSFNEWAHRSEWHIPTGGVLRDFGNAQFTWLAGPHNDRHTADQGYADYYNRIADYYISSGFGTQAQLDALLATGFAAEPIAVRDLPQAP